MAVLFHDIFLSGKTVSTSEIIPIVIVAHSMGGLVVQEALNLLDGGNTKILAIEFISLATPFGGHPSARSSNDTSLMILPSWRDINPDNEFIQHLFRNPLPENVTHYLYYAFSNSDHIKLGENSDGVVPLSSQLRVEAQQQSSRQLGLDVTHTGILTNPAAIAAIVEVLSGVKTGYPDDHMRYFLQGGYEVDVGSVYDERDQYYLRYYGQYIEALAKGEIDPIGPWQEEFVPMLRGQAEPKFEPAKAWLKYIQSG